MGFTPRRRLVTAIAAVTVAAGTALAGLVTGAGAQITAMSTLITTHNGEAGYGTTAPATKNFQDIQAVVTANQYGTTLHGGAVGVQLSTTPVAGVCNAAQLGLVANTATSTYQVDFGQSTIGSAANPCPAGGVIAMPAPLSPTLMNLPNTDSVWLNVTSVQRNVFVCFFVPGTMHSTFTCHIFALNGVLYQAEVLNAATPVLVSKFVPTAANVYTHGSWGTSQDSTVALTPCALLAEPVTPTAMMVSPIPYASVTCQQVAEFDYANISVRGMGAMPLALDSATLTPDMAVAVQAAGAVSTMNPAVVDAHDSLQDVPVFPGNTTLSVLIAALGAVHRAHLTGNSFQLFTANSP